MISPRPKHFLLLLLALAGVAAQTAQTARAADASPPLPPTTADGTRTLHDVPYVTGGTPQQRLDLYLPPASGTPAPLVVWIHGGGWQGGSKASCPAKGALKFGCAAASLDYRLTGVAIYPAQIEDCKAALRFLRAHAAEYGIDPKRIGVWGSSAGGHLVALLGTTGNIRDFDVGENLDQSSAVQCVVDWFGPSDFLNWGNGDNKKAGDPKSSLAKLVGGPIATHQEAARRASPVYFVQKESAPFLIMHGDADPLVPLQQSQELNAALQKAGVESTLVVVPGAGHGGPGFNTPENSLLIHSFFKKHLLDVGAPASPSPKP